MNDSLCSQVIKYCQSSWPKKHMIQSSLKPYWTVRGELAVCNNLLLFNKHIVVPESLKKETLDKIHEGHQGIPVTGELAVCNNLLLFNKHIVVPESLKKEHLTRSMRDIKEFREVALEQHHLSGVKFVSGRTPLQKSH